MINFDDKELRRFALKLERDIGPGLVKATQWTLNKAAKNTQFHARDNLGKHFTTRNKWTERSIQRIETRESNIDKMVTRAGSTEDYLRKQEEGFINRGGEHGVMIPTTFAAGQEGAAKRTKRVRKPFRAPRTVADRITRGTRRQRTARTITSALQQKKRLVFLELSRGRRGIFRLVGSRKNLQVKMVWDMSRKQTKVDPNKWMTEAREHAQIRLARDYRFALQYQLNRIRR